MSLQLRFGLLAFLVLFYVQCRYAFVIKVGDSKQGFQPTILVHGGAGDIANATGKYNGTKAAVRAAYSVLYYQGGTAMDAVIAAIRVSVFNPRGR